MAPKAVQPVRPPWIRFVERQNGRDRAQGELIGPNERAIEKAYPDGMGERVVEKSAVQVVPKQLDINENLNRVHLRTTIYAVVERHDHQCCDDLVASCYGSHDNHIEQNLVTIRIIHLQRVLIRL